MVFSANKETTQIDVDVTDDELVRNLLCYFNISF